MEIKKLLGIAIAAVAVIALVIWLRPSESKRVRKVFATVSKELRKDGPEGLVVATAKAHALAELVATGARFKVDEEVLHGVTGGRQIVQQIMLVRGQADKIEVGFADIAVAFDDERTASVTADVFVRGLSSEMGLSGRDARQLEAVLEKDKDDGKWRFKSVSLLPVVAK
jgi:hypothetical protein